MSDGVAIINDTVGLLGSPKRQGTYLEVKILFEPRIVVGQIIEIQSATVSIFNGVYKVVGFSHSATISQAVNGNAETTLRLWFGTESFKIINGKRLKQ